MGARGYVSAEDIEDPPEAQALRLEVVIVFWAIEAAQECGVGQEGFECSVVFGPAAGGQVLGRSFQGPGV
jgi:hypothetical protein